MEQGQKGSAGLEQVVAVLEQAAQICLTTLSVHTECSQQPWARAANEAARHQALQAARAILALTGKEYVFTDYGRKFRLVEVDTSKQD